MMVFFREKKAGAASAYLGGERFSLCGALVKGIPFRCFGSPYEKTGAQWYIDQKNKKNSAI